MIGHILKVSLDRHFIITIIYQNKNEITQRNIQVYSIQEDNIKAFCFLRNQNRVFKTGNILAADFVRNNRLKAAR